MQTQFEIDTLVAPVAAASLLDHRIVRVSSQLSVDADGLDAVRVTIVLPDDDTALSDESSLDIIVDLRQAFLKAGDERFPFVDFANESELDLDADPEPGSPA